MEKSTFHEHLTRLRQAFPDCESITVPQAAEFYGCKADTLRADKTFPVKKIGRSHRVMLINFARWMAW